MDDFHFDDIIEVSNEDVLEKKYDKVSRIAAHNQDGDVEILLEVNTELYPIQKEEKLRMLLSHTLYADGSAVTSHFPKEKQRSLADKFEYVMHGLTYKMTLDPKESAGALKVEVYISFGGLQLMLKGPVEKMSKFKVDQKLFVLLRKM
ncbi:DNA-directed RNA polymerase [Lithospermum erythrorhizon]|uniref:DNA-directed RNA polymerase n=1 Tax=Lithospermum erythrorhizon TaxID=34254 RepID=A0AAV3RGB1_LITER